MTFQDTIAHLKAKIHCSLFPLIDHDYVLWDLPYHDNIGDILIWQGELDFLHGVNYKCLGIASKDTCLFPSLPKDTIILLHGGGNFGDVWREHQEFRLEVIRKYPDHKIIIFPQTVWYENELYLVKDAEVMAEHKYLILCARDQVSYNCLKTHFYNQILLVPDMAFCIPVEWINSFRVKEANKVLFLKRKDKELGNCLFSVENLSSEVDTRDWPSMEKHTFISKIFSGISYGRQMTGKYFCLHFCKSIFYGLENLYAAHILRPHYIKQGVRFVSQYKQIYTTRLHVLILSVLLSKEVSFWDNSYGKNSSFYNTWLADLAEVKEYIDLK